LLRLRRKVLELLEDYQFELITNETLTATNYALNAELKNNWQSTGAFEYIKGTVYASSYDKKQKQARVRIEMQFSAILERFIINLVVK
jgi:predicted Zn-dependent protease